MKWHKLDKNTPAKTLRRIQRAHSVWLWVKATATKNTRPGLEPDVHGVCGERYRGIKEGPVLCYWGTPYGSQEEVWKLSNELMHSMGVTDFLEKDLKPTHFMEVYPPEPAQRIQQ